MAADTAVASSTVENLEKREVGCWLAPRDVRPGTEYADAIVAAINEAKAIVLVLSGSAVASSHVGREIERAACRPSTQDVSAQDESPRLGDAHEKLKYSSDNGWERIAGRCP